MQSHSNPTDKSSAGTVTRQTELIALYTQMRSESLSCNQGRLRAHYDHLLLALGKIIESYGPTPEYYEWFNSTSPT
jgi:hypothetical protein